MSEQQTETPQFCAAEEWHRDGRGHWAMRACRNALHAELRECSHAFGPWKLGIESPFSRLTAVEEERDELKAYANAKDAELRRAYLHATADTTHLESQLTLLQQERRELLTLLAEATNGWGCHAKRDAEHEEIHRLHKARARFEERP